MAARAASSSSVRSSSCWRRSRICCSSSADAGPQGLGFVGASEAAGLEDLFAEDFGQPGGEVGVLLAEPLVLVSEVGQVGEQGLPAAAVEAGLVSGAAARAWIWARRSWWR